MAGQHLAHQAQILLLAPGGVQRDARLAAFGQGVQVRLFSSMRTACNSWRQQDVEAQGIFAGEFHLIS